jgi:hypothetical protein
MACSKPAQCTEEVKALLTDALKLAETQLVAGCRKFLKVCKNHNISYEINIPSKLVWLSEKNRNKLGLSPIDVYELMDSIQKVGYSDDEVKAVCREANQAGPELDAVIEFNTSIVKASKGMLPAFSKELLKYKALWGSHANLSLHCIAAQLPHTNKVLTVDGRLNAEKIRETQPDWAERVHTGMKWTVLPDWLFSVFENLETLMQSAGNVTQQVAKAESMGQVLTKIYTDMTRMGQPVDFAALKNSVLRSSPPFQDCIGAMSAFVLKWGGDGVLLHQSIAFQQTRAGAKRFISSDMWDALCPDFKVGNVSNQCVHFRYALWRAAMSLDIKVQQHESKFITSSHARKMFTKDGPHPKVT